MDFDRFSLEEFEKRGLDSPEAKQLANELEQAVVRELHIAMMPTIRRIVNELNTRGHRLAFYGEPIAGEVEYRHEDGDGEKGLRLAVDTVISAGYSHLASHDQTPEEIIEEVANNLRKALEPDNPS